MEKQFCVYVIHNIINNKLYVGKAQNVKARWRGHIYCARGNGEPQFAIHRAIAKYGVNNFEFSIVQKFDNGDDCLKAEIYWIEYFKSRESAFGYNLTTGGEGVPGRVVSEKTRELIRAKNTGKKHSKETVEKMSGENSNSAKLTETQVKEIRNDFSSKTTFDSFAAKYGVDRRTIRNVIYNLCWVDSNYTPPISKVIENGRKPKITAEKADEIRKEFDNSNYTNAAALANKYSMSRKHIREILNNDVWKTNYESSRYKEIVKKLADLKALGISPNAGENNYNTKLNKEQVLEIREKFASGKYTKQQLAQTYNVSRISIRSIVNKFNWKHM